MATRLRQLVNLLLCASLALPSHIAVAAQVRGVPPTEKPKSKRNKIKFSDSKTVDAKPKVNPRNRLIQFGAGGWIDPNNAKNNVDVSGLTDLSQQGDGATGSGSGSGSGGKGGGAGGGNFKPGSGPSNSSIGFDPNAQKNNDDGTKVGGDNGGGGGGGGGRPPGATTETASGGGKAFDLWYPMCLWIDPSESGNANAAVKGLVDDAAKCEVNLVVFPITVNPNYAGSFMEADAVNQKQTQACNIAGNFKNATRASTSICTRFDQMADKMCEQKKIINGQVVYERDTAGCAQINSADGGQSVQNFINQLKAEKARLQASGDTSGRIAQIDKRLKDIEKDGSTGGSSTPVAPSIEDAGSCDKGTVGHEALGHSMWGHPNGASDGHGIGLEETGGGGGGWTTEGCTHMKRNAFRNDGTFKWDASRTTYYVPTPPNLWWDLNSGRQLFGPRNQPPPGGAAQIVRSNDGGGNRLDPNFFNNPGAAAGGATPPPTQTASGANPTPPKPATIDERHKERPKPADALVSNAKPKTTPPPVPSDDQPLREPGIKSFPKEPPGKPNPTYSIGFDPNAKKSNDSSNGVSAVGKIDRSKNGRESFNDPGSNSSAVSSSGDPSMSSNSSNPNLASGGGKGSGGSSIGFDPNAKKENSNGTVVEGANGGSGGSSLSTGLLGGKGSSGGSGSSNGGYSSSVGGGKASAGTIVKAGSSSLDDGFFSSIGDFAEEEREKRKKRKDGATTLRGPATLEKKRDAKGEGRRGVTDGEPLYQER